MLPFTAAGVVGAAGWPLLSLQLLLVGRRMGRRGRGGQRRREGERGAAGERERRILGIRFF